MKHCTIRMVNLYEADKLFRLVQVLLYLSRESNARRSGDMDLISSRILSVSFIVMS